MSKKILKNIFDVLRYGYNVFRKLGKQEKKSRKQQEKKSTLNNKKETKPIKNESKIHPWRLCPEGEHWVVTHDLTVPVSEKNPDGKTIRHGHCRANPSRKDIIKPDEIIEIAQTNFSDLQGPPTPNNLGFKDGNKYDHLIRGWVKYWNEVLKPNEPLDPNLIKALIASESGFNLIPKEGNAGSAGKARGLIQITDKAQKGELKDNLIYLEEKDLNDPNISICAGTRWLFQKKKLASHRLKREATWQEAVSEYKGYLRDQISGKNPNPKGMENFNSKYKILKGEK